MGLDRAIEHGKERRQGYRGSARFDRTCRPHGGGTSIPCPWCERNRLIGKKRDAERAEDEMRALKSNE